jgi:hypothetical protein
MPPPYLPWPQVLHSPWLPVPVQVLEPRRVAARGAAHRMASLLGQSVGGEVGYTVRHESRKSKRTRVLVVTEGVLVRRLQSDPGLDGVAAVVFDEFHERSVDADLALALCREAQQVAGGTRVVLRAGPAAMRTHSWHGYTHVYSPWVYSYSPWPYLLWLYSLWLILAMAILTMAILTMANTRHG